MLRHLLVPVVLSLLLLQNASAQQIGDPDSTFSADGITTTHIGSAGGDWGNDMAVQPDGRILVGGTSFVNGVASFALVRYDLDGALDPTFGTAGVVTTMIPGEAAAVALQPDGRIVITGYANTVDSSGVAVVRYNPDGSLDSTFGGDGIVMTDVGPGQEVAYAAAIQPDGKIVIGASSGIGVAADMALLRYNTDGSLDTSFSGDGMCTIDAGGSSNDFLYAMVLQPDGRIVAAGYAPDVGLGFPVVRFNADGTMDQTFGVNGVATVPIFGRAFALAVQPDGKIVTVGYEEGGGFFKMAIARLETDGSLDASFSSDGYLVLMDYIVSWGRGVALMPDGRIVVSGAAQPGTEIDFLVAMFNTDGTLDPTFSADGLQTTDIGNHDYSTAAAVQADGRILAAGYAQMMATSYDFAVVRYLPYLNVGMLEFADAASAPLIFPNPIGESVTLQYELKNSGPITIRLADAQGRTVLTFLDGVVQPAGEQRVDLQVPKTIAPGSYVITIASADQGAVNVQVVKD